MLQLHQLQLYRIDYTALSYLILGERITRYVYARDEEEGYFQAVYDIFENPDPAKRRAGIEMTLTLCDKPVPFCGGHLPPLRLAEKAYTL